MERCILTVTADQTNAVEQLQNELSKKYQSVALLALGSQPDVESIQSHLPEAISLVEIGEDYQEHHIIVTSIPALLELGNSLTKFQSVTLWTDPEIHPQRENHSPFAQQFSTPLSLVRGTICEALSSLALSFLVSRSAAGQNEWHKAYGAQLPVATELMVSTFDSESNSEPLIENSGRQRLLIDAGNGYTTIQLVEPFIVLQEQLTETEIWCYYEGELPLWMKPDFQIQHIPNEEIPLYTNSIDGVILTGDTLNRRRTIEYMRLGIFPIVINKEIAEELSNIIDTSAISTSFPSFGSENIIFELAESKERLALYNSYSKSSLKSNVLFEPSILVENSTNTKALASFLSSSNFISSRNLYLESLYGDPEGSDLHKTIAKTEHLIGKITGQQASLTSFSGWAVNTTKQCTAEIIIYRNGCEIPAMLLRKHRADVTNALDLDKGVLSGFNAVIPMSNVEDINLHNIAMTLSGKIEIIEAYEADLSSITTLPEPVINGASTDDQRQSKGVLELLESTDVVAIELSDFISQDEDLILSFKNDDNLLPLTEVSIYLSTKDDFTKLSSEYLETSDNTLSLMFCELTESATLYIESENTRENKASDITCHVFSNKRSESSSSLNQNTTILDHDSDTHPNKVAIS